jgi:hypothetical protein
MRKFHVLILFGFLKVYLLAQSPLECVVIDSSGKSPAKPYGKAIANLGGDDKPDIFISSAQDDGMHWYQSPDWIKKVIRSSGSWSEDCQILDIDNDGDNDIDIVLGMIWLENNGDGNAWQEHKYSENMPEQVLLKIADMNRDGIPDIIACLQSSQACNFAWYSNKIKSDTFWIEHIIQANITHIHGLAVADFNNDGVLDIHTSTRHDHPGNQDNVSIWLSDGKPLPVFTEHVIATTGSHYSKIGDIDYDGDIDIIGANWSGFTDLRPDIFLWRNKLK